MVASRLPEPIDADMRGPVLPLGTLRRFVTLYISHNSYRTALLPHYFPELRANHPYFRYHHSSTPSNCFYAIGQRILLSLLSTMDLAHCLDTTFPRCLLGQTAKSINHLPQEILECIIAFSVSVDDFQVSMPATFSPILPDCLSNTRTFAAAFLVNRRFYHAASAAVIPSLTLSAENLHHHDVGSWMRRLQLCPKGQLRKLEIRYYAFGVFKRHTTLHLQDGIGER